MNLEKLEVGLIVKNYKEMCSLFGEGTCTGKSKELQLKNWNRFFNHQKQGHKFIITEIFKEAKPKQKASRRGVGSVYSNMIQSLIVHMLLKNETHTFSVSKSKFIEDLGITNRNYSESKSYLLELSQFLEIDIKYIYDFYNINDSNFTGMVERALEILEDKRIIRVSNIVKVKMINENKTRQATDFEVSKISGFEKDILESMGYESISEIRKSRDWKSFKSKVRNIIHEELNIQYYYDAYKLTINEKYLESEKDKLKNLILSSEELKSTKTELNDLVSENIVNNSKKRAENVSMTDSKYEIRTNDYVNKTGLLNNNLVKHNTSYIVPFLKMEDSVAFKEVFPDSLPF